MKKNCSSIIESLKENNKIPMNFVEILQSDRPIVLYGCGNQGSICEDILSCSMNFSIACFAVSDGKSKDTKWNSKIPVYHISELVFDKESCDILITLGDGDTVYTDLKRRGYKHICKIDDWEEVNEALREVSLRNLCERNGVNLSVEEEIISYQKFKFINALRENKMVKTMFIREFENITAKHIFHESKEYQVESSYECGQVIMEEGDVVFDCGANIGIFSAVAASLGCSVYAFEPVQFIANYTKKVAELYHGKMKVVDKVLSNQVGEISFVEVNSDYNYAGDSSKILVDGQYNESETHHLTKVPSITIDEYVRQNKIPRIDFIKADIEGAERQMLSGAKKTLAELAPKLSICTYHLPDDREVLTNIIMAANGQYKIEYKWDKLYAYVPDKYAKS